MNITCQAHKRIVEDFNTGLPEGAEPSDPLQPACSAALAWFTADGKWDVDESYDPFNFDDLEGRIPERSGEDNHPSAVWAIHTLAPDHIVVCFCVKQDHYLWCRFDLVKEL